MIAVPVNDLSPKRWVVGRSRAHSGGCFRIDRSRGESVVTAGDEPLVVAPEGATTAGSASNGGHSRGISKTLPRGVAPRMTTRTRKYLWYETTRATEPLCTLTASCHRRCRLMRARRLFARRRHGTTVGFSRITPPKGCGAWMQTRRQTGYLPGGGR
jgi:hypothetical protein